MLHKKMSGINNHPIHSWRVADETARLALVLEADDEGRVCWQEDNDTYWTLLDYSVPIWKNMIGSDGLPGADGADGKGIVSVVRTAGTGAAGSTDTYTITFSDATTTTFTVVNGANGADGIDGTNGVDGADGKGIVSIARTAGTGAAGTTDTYTITFTDVTTATFTVVNGSNGTNGADGTDGADGVGVPVGGTTGQILAKASATDHDTVWIDPPTGGGGSGTVKEVVAGHAVTVDNTDPANPVVAVPGGKYTNSLTAPSGSVEGDRWYHPGDGALYTRILDGATLVWAQVG